MRGLRVRHACHIDFVVMLQSWEPRIGNPFDNSTRPDMASLDSLSSTPGRFPAFLVFLDATPHRPDGPGAPRALAGTAVPVR